VLLYSRARKSKRLKVSVQSKTPHTALANSCSGIYAYVCIVVVVLCINSLSPVAYAGWTQDSAELINLAAGGPAAWLALLSALHNDGLSRLHIVAQALV
jgi:hypothetical protein